jgi:citrate lyase subunit beta/citryl-CoA lyase
MLECGADVLIVDLEDFTPTHRRGEARELLARYVQGCRSYNRIAAIRINALENDGMIDLEYAMKTRPDVIAYPMTERPAQVHSLHSAITHWEHVLGSEPNSTEILPVCETALGVMDIRAIAAGSTRIRCALLGAEDLANDLGAELGHDEVELDYSRRRFVLECRAAGIEPIDAPYTFSDAEGAAREAKFARRLGYRSVSLVRTEYAEALNRIFTPSEDELVNAQAIVDGFDAARARGEDRALVNDLWVEVPTYRNARRLIERAHRLSTGGRDVDPRQL